MQPREVKPPLLRQSRFVTFDGAVALSTSHQRPDRYRHLEHDFARAARIPRGGGYSYAAASFGERVIVQEMTAFNRLLAFDPRRSSVRVEGGVTLNRLLEWAIQRDLYFPVLPGYPLITVGGCVAADVHGKNPLRDGTFGDWVEAMTVYHPAAGYQSITRISQPELFAATCGGFGLTGIIVDATLRLIPLPSRAVVVEKNPVASLAEAVARLTSLSTSDFAYSWHDGTARNGAFGRGVVFRGEWADAVSDPTRFSYRSMTATERGRLPWALWNRASLAMGNASFRAVSRRSAREVKNVFDVAFPFARQTAYHRMFGRKGFAEAQVLVPHRAFADFVRDLAAQVSRMNPCLALLSAKVFSGRQASLSMSGDGILIALDLVRDTTTEKFLTEFDALTISMGAQPNLAKDSRLPLDVATRTIPGHGRFCQAIHRIDPDRLYQSELSRRLGL